MTGGVSAYNQTQKTLANIQQIGTSVVVGTTAVTLYTVPAGKKAMIIAFADQSVALGANTSMHANVKGVSLRIMTVAESAITNENIQGTLLIAGDTITLVGNNAGNNGTINYFISIQELPA